MNQSEMAKKIIEITGEGITKYTISNYESGTRNVPVALITVFARIFGVTTDRLLYAEDEFPRAVDDDTGILKLRLKNALETIAELKSENQLLRQKQDKMDKKIGQVIKSLNA